MKDVRAELVRVDARGEAHAIGSVASGRLRARAGTYRLLPAPGHVVFMRYTGEDGLRDATDGAVVRLAGEVTAPGAMCDVLALLAQTGWRGQLVVFEGECVRSIFFEHGNVVGVKTNVDEERLGQVLYRFGGISSQQHERIMDRVRAGERFGASAVDLGILSQEQVYAYIGKQVEEVVYTTLTVSDGTYFFMDGFDDAELVSRHTVSANSLLMEGVTRMDELRYFREKIPSNDYVPVRQAGRSAPSDELLPTYEAVDGKRSIEEIGRTTGRGEFGTTKDVYTLLQSQHVVVHPPRASGGPVALVKTANAALRAVMRAADAEGKGESVRQSLGSFAVGAGVYDLLFRRAGPDRNGALDPEAVAANSIAVAAGEDPENLLKQLLHEYVSFALFSAGGALGTERESELKKEVNPIIASLRPQS